LPSVPAQPLRYVLALILLLSVQLSVGADIMKSFATAAICIGLLAGSSIEGQAQISDYVVKIGVLDDMSGLYADIQGPGDVVAVKLAVEDFGGSVNGKPIEVVSSDLQNKADVGSAIARRWYDVERVDAVLGLGNSAVAICRPGHLTGEASGRHYDSRRFDRIDGEVLRAARDTLGLRHLRACKGNSDGDDETRWCGHLVLHHD
jgi:hypothetical protein